jgi:hypothetical protein
MININPQITGIVMMVLFTIVAANVYSKNFLFSYGLVKMSNENKVLLQLLTKTGFVFKAAKLKESLLEYSIDRKTKGTISIEKAKVYRALGVNHVIAEQGTDRVINDEKKNVVKGVPITLDFTGQRGATPAEYDNLLRQALTKPSMNQFKENLVPILIVGVGAICLFILFQLNGLQEQVAQLVVDTASSTISGGNVN